MAEANMGEVRRVLVVYYDENHEYPAELSVLDDQFPGSMLVDPFTEKAYSYTTDGQTFTLTCLGNDGVVGGTEHDADIVFNENGYVGNE